MKRIQIIIPVLLGAFCTGCDLDIEPQDRYDQQTFWYSAKAAEGGLTGCYNALLENGIYGRAAVYWEDDATPNGYNFSNDDSWTTIANGAQTATSGGIIANRWSHAYKGIGRCNTLLDNIDLNRELDKSVIEEYKNQARFLRVLFYYMLTTYYGDCPLITTTPAMEHKSLPRTPRTEVVSFMLSELEQLSKVLPPKAEPGRPTSGAALALKARILLFEASPLLNPGHDDQKWRDAADAARAVMDCDSDYELFTAPGQIGSAYRNLFLESGENSSECIFSVQCMNQNKLGLSFELIARQYGTMAPLRDLIDFYCDRDGNARTPGEQRLDPSKIDPRFGATIVYPGCKFMGSTVTATQFQQTGCTIKKYTVYDEHTPTAAEKSIGDTESPIDYMILRYADILLMYAEALNEYYADPASAPEDGIRWAIDQVRSRAGMPGVDETFRNRGWDLTQENVRKFIQNERRVEFAFEEQRFWDIRRWMIGTQTQREAHELDITLKDDDLTKVYKSRKFENRIYEDHMNLMPIPQSEINKNPNLVQNWGWSPKQVN